MKSKIRSFLLLSLCFVMIFSNNVLLTFATEARTGVQNETQTQVITETEQVSNTESPKTGDDTNYIIYIFLLVGAAVVAGGILIIGRYRKRK